MKVSVNDDCVGDGVCAEVCPEVFKMEGDQCVVKKESVCPELEDLIRKAAQSCPVDAIFLDE